MSLRSKASDGRKGFLFRKLLNKSYFGDYYGKDRLGENDLQIHIRIALRTKVNERFKTRKN